MDTHSCKFLNYDFSKGFNGLLNFLSADLSGIYLDIIKDRLYCDDKDSPKRKSAQVAMVLITKELLNLLAPNLTYSVDEALEHSNVLIKGEALDVFDLSLEEKFEYDFKIDDKILLLAREKFFEFIDTLKKDKMIKSTLELELQTNSKAILALPRIEMADWFIVSVFEKMGNEEALFEFEIENQKFKIIKAKHNKCPRCWKFEAQNELCPRCQGVFEEEIPTSLVLITIFIVFFLSTLAILFIRKKDKND